ncbi:MAG: 3'(2'),5'-bisphosphate nucleotidase CysQ [Alphaproteobacteria bacterium]|nr:3'(2'),5'-bisphosphate nucleotidase CysQ [Alphaproteobacteria bacterium]
MEAAAREAGALTRQHFGRAVKTWSKGAAGPVTEIDLAVDALIKERLMTARPDYGWLSEETEDNDQRLFRARAWIIDPIDGTQAFIQGVPQYTISVGLAENGRAVAGAVYNPMTDEMFMGGEGAPASVNGRPVRASVRSELEGARMIGQPSTFKAKRWARPWPKLEIEPRHSIAYRLALVAGGSYDAALMLGFKNEWDVAAGVAIVTAAGGVVSETTGAPLAFNRADPRVAGVVACGTGLYPSIIERVQGLPHPKDWGPKGWDHGKGEGRS